MENIGKDLSTELNNTTYRSCLEYVLNHHKVGRYAPSVSEEKVTNSNINFAQL